MMKLVVCEKPSVAKSIASVLGANIREDGYLSGCGSPVTTSACHRHAEALTEPEGETGYIVSWCFGHLAELADAEAYDERYGKWKQEDLPILPNVWQYTVARDKKKQLDLLGSLMNRNDVAEVINACDAGREGELIFRTVYNLNKCHKPMKRLWISSMEDKAILEGFENLHDGSDYDSLYASALCRSKADWLVGINATRLFSTMYHRTLNVGRVVSPTLAILVQREAEISAFVPEAFYTVHPGFGDFTAAGERIKDKDEAKCLAEKLSGQNAAVKSVTQTEKTEKAPALYDLTTLQRDANRILGYTAQQTLDYLQSLYEKKLCTYPRTDSRYLTDDMKNGVKALVLCCAGICGMEPPYAVLTGQVCNSRKVSDHHAVIPTMAGGEADLSTLPAGEREIMLLISRQVLMAVSEPFVYRETTVTMDCGGMEYSAKGKSVIQPGWRACSGADMKDKALPALSEGQVLTVSSCEVKDGKTTPPKHFTEDTILASMETAGKEDMPEDSERKGIGTPATRAGIIEKLISTGFVERNKGKKAVNLIPTATGVSLITVLPEQLQSPLLTAEWEHRLKEIEHGEAEADVFIEGIVEMVSELVRDYKPVSDADVLFPSGRPVVGKCPRCGADVTESKKGYFCERRDCSFGLWRDNKFLLGKKINLTKKMASSLLKDGRTYASGIYSEKTGKTYDAFIVLTDDGTRSSYKLDFTK